MFEALSIPFGLLQDLIAIHQIQTEGYERVLSDDEEQEEFFGLLTWK